MSHIQLRDVSKRYAPDLPAVVSHVNLDIAAGEFCVFVGPSGCGKSTLLRMVAGLEPISEGDLLIDGQRMNEVHPAQRGVAMVFQSYALYPHMSVFDNMAFGLQVNGVPRAELERKVREAAASLELTPLLQRMPKALSGGQRQRVAIGRAIVKQPKVFLFDEPLSNLDAALRAATRVEIARLHRELGSASMIYVTHDQVEALTLAQKIVLLHAGERIASHGSVAQMGSPMSLYHRPCSRFVAEFMGSPRINILEGTLQQAQPDRAWVDLFGQAPVAACVDATALAPGSHVQLGVRPEHLHIGAIEGCAQFQASVTHLEQLGDSSLLYLQTATAQVLTVRVDGFARQRMGEGVLVSLAADKVHLFGADGQACRRTVQLPE